MTVIYKKLKEKEVMNNNFIIFLIPRKLKKKLLFEKVSNKTGTKNNKEYNLINSYEVLIISEIKKIIRKRTESNKE